MSPVLKESTEVFRASGQDASRTQRCSGQVPVQVQDLLEG